MESATPSLAVILAGLGTVVVLGVGLHSWWDMRRSRRREGAARGRSTRISEPGLGPELGLGVDAAGGFEGDDRLDERFYLCFQVSAGLATEGLQQRFSSLGHLGGKPLVVSATRAHSGLSVGLLLANRAGPLTLVDYEAFVDLLVRMVPGLAKVDVEERLLAFPEAYRRARGLASQLETLDGQLALHLKGESPSAVALSELADDRGLLPRGEGRYSRMDDRGEVAFSLLRGEHGVALTLLLDFPRCYQPLAQFDELLSVAQSLVQVMNGQLVDDSHRALSEEALMVVRGQVEDRVADFLEAGIEPGSALARRLFQ